MYIKTIIELFAFIAIIWAIARFAVFMGDRSKRKMEKLSNRLWMQRMINAADAYHGGLDTDGDIPKEEIKRRLNSVYGRGNKWQG